MDNQHETLCKFSQQAVIGVMTFELSAGCVNSSYTTHVVQYNNSVRMECAAYDSYRWWQSEDGCRRFSLYSPCDGRQVCTVRIDESRGRYLYYCCTENAAELTSSARKTCFEIDSKSDSFVLSMYLNLIPRWFFRPGNKTECICSLVPRQFFGPGNKTECICSLVPRRFFGPGNKTECICSQARISASCSTHSVRTSLVV